MTVEVKKILDPKIKLSATCVRVPVFVGHSEAVNIEYDREMSAAKAKSILREAPGIMLIDKHEDGGYATPIEAAGDDATYISRVREDPRRSNSPVSITRSSLFCWLSGTFAISSRNSVP